MKRDLNTIKIVEKLYSDYHKREYVHPDPLEFLYNYKKIEDREIVGLIASSLAIGRVNAILGAVSTVLALIPSPKKDLLSMNKKEIKDKLAGFKYRFYDENKVSAFLIGIKSMIESYGSLENAFINLNEKSENNYLQGQEAFVLELKKLSKDDIGTLVSLPSKGSACKRLNLFMRWMVRKDDIDPGGWKGLNKADLIIPLDVHMNKVSHILGFTKRKQPDLKAAIEITESLKKIDKLDPVRFDFSLTRPGIHPQLDELSVLLSAKKIA